MTHKEWIKLTPEQQRSRVAELAGWTCRKVDVSGPRKHALLWFGPNGEANRDYPPDYLHDLNAMHEAEMSIPFSKRRYFRNNLRLLMSAESGNYLWGDCVHATAAQRAEAFVITMEGT
jgi:hypothetical protein